MSTDQSDLLYSMSSVFDFGLPIFASTPHPSHSSSAASSNEKSVVEVSPLSPEITPLTTSFYNESMSNQSSNDETAGDNSYLIFAFNYDGHLPL